MYYSAQMKPTGLYSIICTNKNVKNRRAKAYLKEENSVTVTTSGEDRMVNDFRGTGQ